MTILDDAREGMDPDTRPQDDLFRHVNGRWLDTTEIPADRSSWGALVSLSDQSEDRVRTIIHELGGARMGSDPSKSVVNSNCQAHDVKNLFVTDGSPFVSQADKNPTWTILALAWRTSDYIAEQRKAGAI